MYTKGMNTRQRRLSTNLYRFMAKFDLDLPGVISATQLDERTVRSILKGTVKPHPRTLQKLSDGLGVSLRELTADPNGALVFDRATNPVVREVLETHWDAEFAHWPDDEIDELFSRFATGGALTEEGILEIVRFMNERRAYIEKLKVIFETPDRELVKSFLETLYARNIQQPDPEPSPDLRIARVS